MAVTMGMVMRVIVVARGTVAVVVPVTHGVVEQPHVDAIHHDGQDGEDEHDAGPRGPVSVERLERLCDDETRAAEDKDGAEDGGHGLGASQAEREPGRRRPNGEAHGEQAHAEREDIGQEMQRVRLQDDALGEHGADQLEGEEARDDPQHHGEATRLPRLSLREAVLARNPRRRRLRAKARRGMGHHRST
jgi:hypothetical protein